MKLAATEPVELIVPRAVAHWPTATAADVPVAVCVKVVFAVNATLIVSGAGVVAVVVGVAPAGFWGERMVPWTTIALALAETTDPKAMEKLAGRAGLEPAPGDPPKKPPGPPGNRRPPGVPADPPVEEAALPIEHVPDDSAGEMATELAVMSVAVDPAMPVIDTHWPCVSELAVTSDVTLKVVDELQSTVVCPEVGSWTSIEVPLTEAIVPTAPGKVVGVTEVR